MHSIGKHIEHYIRDSGILYDLDKSNYRLLYGTCYSVKKNIFVTQMKSFFFYIVYLFSYMKNYFVKNSHVTDFIHMVVICSHTISINNTMNENLTQRC